MVDSTKLPNVDINQIATDLNGKMDRDGVNASCPTLLSRTANSYGGVVEIWSDGYCVQTFRTTVEAGVVSLPQAFKDTNYSVYGQMNGTDKAYLSRVYTASQKTVNSFYWDYKSMANAGSGSYTYSDIRAEGYIR